MQRQQPKLNWLFEDMIPEPYMKFCDIFEKKNSDRFPLKWPWDHEIKLKLDFTPWDCKIYSLMLKAQILLDDFLDKNLKKGYICPLKSPMAIGHYSDIVWPLINLTKKDQAFAWKDDQENAFQLMKKKFVEALILLLPNPEKPFLLESNALKWAMGAVLKQQNVNREWHPCGYLSQTFTDMQRNYDVGDRELLRIITALESWRHYL